MTSKMLFLTSILFSVPIGVAANSLLARWKDYVRITVTQNGLGFEIPIKTESITIYLLQSKQQ